MNYKLTAFNPLRPGRSYRSPAAILIGFLIAAVALTQLALIQPLYAAAALYAAGFMLLAWRRPDIALMLIFISVPFQTDVSGGGPAKASIAEVNLLLMLPVLYCVCLAQRRLPRVGPILLPICLYLIVCGVSSAQQWRGSDAVLSLFQMVLYMVIAVSVFSSLLEQPERLLLCLRGLVVVGVLLALAALATHNSFLGLNKNGIGGSLSCIDVVCVELWFAEKNPKKKRLLALAMMVVTVALFFTLSRGAWLGGVAGILLLVGFRREYSLLLKVSLVMVPLIVVCWNLLPAESRGYAAGVGSDRPNISLRYKSVDLAKTYYKQNPLLGAGVGLRKEYDATNLVMSLLAETGLLGLGTFLLIHVVYFRMIWKTQKYVARTEVMYSLLAVGGALVLDHTVHGLVDHYWGRGPLMAAWISAGMATSVYFTARERARKSQGQAPPEMPPAGQGPAMPRLEMGRLP